MIVWFLIVLLCGKCICLYFCVYSRWRDTSHAAFYVYTCSVIHWRNCPLTVCSWHLCQILGTHSDGFVSGCSVLFHWSVSVHTSAPFWIDCWWRSPSLTSSILFIVLDCLTLQVCWDFRRCEFVCYLGSFDKQMLSIYEYRTFFHLELTCFWQCFVSFSVYITDLGGSTNVLVLCYCRCTYFPNILSNKIFHGAYNWSWYSHVDFISCNYIDFFYCFRCDKHFFGIKYHAICNRNNFISSFLIWLLFYFSCLIAGAITSRTMLNTNSSHMQNCLLYILEEELSTFSSVSLSVTLTVGLSYIVITLLWFMTFIIII